MLQKLFFQRSSLSYYHGTSAQERPNYKEFSIPNQALITTDVSAANGVKKSSVTSGDSLV